MELYIERVPMYVSAAKVLLAAVGPAQRLVHKPSNTHLMCNRQARIILFNDGYSKYSEIAEEFSYFMDKGVLWADEGFKNMSHFFNPKTLKGLSGWTDAVTECNGFWNKAVKNWCSKNYEKSFFYLGAALHLIQDMCVPHHTAGKLLDGHQEYEDFAELNRDNYRIEKSGMYSLGKHPVDWLKSNAIKASKYYDLVKLGSTVESYDRATSVLLPRAQAVTAGFIWHFLNKMGI